MANTQNGNWRKEDLMVFWGEVAPCEHVVQIYENDKVFLESLTGYVGTGFLSGDAVIVIATAEHIKALERALTSQGFNLSSLKARKQYVPLDASESLKKFMVNNWPDEDLFVEFVTGILNSVKSNRKVRAYGEMVALLWEQGLNGATVQLENLWNKLHHHHDFTLFCAYPKIGFTQDIHNSIESICSVHAKVINGEQPVASVVQFRDSTS
jgi:hypothetical protein